MGISVVTVALNAGADLPLTIESVRQQDYGDVEHVVVDGSSCDATAEVLARYADAIDKVVLVEDAGIYHAMNLALDHCTKDFVLFLNAKDTLFTAATLSRMMAGKRESVDVFYGNHVYVSGGRGYLKKSMDQDLAARRLLRGEVDHHWLARRPGHQATFMRTSLLRRLRFNTDIEICADHDVLMRAYRHGASFQYIDEVVSHYVGGGFSSQRPHRLMLEWCALYREFSAKPAAVDRLFLGDTPSPFGPQTASMGACLSGTYPREGGSPNEGIVKPVSWFRVGDARLRASATGPSRALWIEGFNPFDGQQIDLFHGGEHLGTLRLGRGWFERTIEFAQDVPPLAIVDVAFTRFGEVPNGSGRVVSLAVASFAFEVPSSPVTLSRGDRIAFSTANQGLVKSLLGNGWGNQEDGHVWSVGEVAELRLRTSPGVVSVVLTCGGNPFIEDAAQRGVEVTVNGRPAGRHGLSPDGLTELDLTCPETEGKGYARILLRPFLRSGSVDDPRPLGVCLVALECR